MRTHWFFDFDGTLCDTEEDIRRAWKAAIADLGRDCPHFDAVYRTGPTIDQVVHSLFDDATPELVERIRALFMKHYDASGFPATRPYPWVQGWLVGLKEAGCHLYVATNKRWRPTQILRDMLGWGDLFDGWYSFDMFEGERLSKAELLKRVIERRGIDPSDAVMVGDTEGDIIAGRAAGMYTVGCAWGYGKVDELKGADEIHGGLQCVTFRR